MWPNGVVRGLLAAEILGTLAWLSGYAYLSLLGGLIGFQEFWRLPVGIGVLTLLLLAYWSLELAAEARLLAMTAFLASGAAILLADRWEGLVVVRVGLVGCAIVGIVAAIASYLDQR